MKKKRLFDFHKIRPIYKQPKKSTIIPPHPLYYKLVNGKRLSKTIAESLCISDMNLFLFNFMSVSQSSYTYLIRIALHIYASYWR